MNNLDKKRLKDRNRAKPIIIGFAISVIYEYLILNDWLFDVEELANNHPLLYKILIPLPLILLLCYLIIYTIYLQIKETYENWKYDREGFIDSMKLYGIGVLFFIFLLVMYKIFLN